MKQFFAIFKFEILAYLKNKLFVGLTIAVVFIIAIGLSYPRIKIVLKPDEVKAPASSTSEKTKIAVCVKEGLDEATVISLFQSTFGDEYEINAVKDDEKELTKKIKDGDYDNGLVINSPLSYKYITETKELSDSTTYMVDEVLTQMYRMTAIMNSGVTANDAQKILTQTVENEIVVIGNDQTQSFIYTYIIIMLLYMSILLYGQFVAQSVAAEKSSRAMEMLVTSAKPINLMFGKVLGSGFAGLLQFVVLLTSAYGFYSINETYWKDNELIQSAFGMPAEILFYAVVFFVLGYFIYSFIYGALGSLATRTEDINTLTMPVTFIFVAAFMIIISSITSGNVDSPLMVFCSYFPLTSPMAMFARLSMSTVPIYEIILSVSILIVSEIAIGYLSAVIYRAGVLMYGNTPKIKDIFKIFKRQKQN
ncbi:MAG: ABC transporter permease [Clostridia bacterium]|nr:ABC transporter permease [Clostridia bacterium]